MHDAIHAQPAAFRELLARHAGAAAAFAAGIDPAGRVYLVGTGTSLHAAMIGEHLLRAGRALPVPAFDFALYGPALHSEDTVVVISHRGTKRYSLAALERAVAAGCRTALVCGEGAPPPPHPPDAVFPTVPQERSSAHTISCVGTVAVLAALGRLPAAEVPAALEQVLAAEPEVAAATRGHTHHRRIWIVGAGPDAAVAAEAALKIKETSYGQAEGMGVEAMIHGPAQSAAPEDLFIVLLTAGPGRDRLITLAAMAGDIGASVLPVGDHPEGLRVPAVPPPFACLGHLLAMQLFAYHLALAVGTNPDGFRLEDPRFARASKRVDL